MKYVPTFRADLHAEELVHERISACDLAFAERDIELIQGAVESFENWVLEEGFGDEPVLKELQRIEKEYDNKYKQKYIEYIEELDKALCPDVVLKPSLTPDIMYFRQKYIAFKSCCQRKKMLFRKSYTEQI